MLTTEDWLERVRGGGDVSEGLAEAERVARRADDWIATARVWAEHGELEEARRCLETGLESARGEHWPCRRAAELLMQLGDREAASAAVGRVEARLASATPELPARAYEWMLLAQAYREVLDDEAAVSRCIASATAQAEQANELADLASGYVKLRGDAAGARALLERAEQLAREQGRHRDLWMIAVHWRESLHDDGRARTALALATAETRDVSTLTSLAIAWRSLFGDEESLRGALARGEALATQAGEWLALAEAWRDGGDSERGDTWEPAAVRRCLEAALSSSPGPTDEQRAHLAAAWRRWLGEPARANAVGPVASAPEAELPPVRHLEGWEARDPRALFDRVRARVRPEMLEAIANADYGHASVKHLQSLVEIQATGAFSIPLDWYPLEVLSLTKWSEGAKTDHVQRAFACAVLALEGVHPRSHQTGELSDALAPLIESAWNLQLSGELEQLLVWITEVIEPAEGYVWPLFGLVLTRARYAPEDPRLGALVALLEEAEAVAEHVRPEAGWLLRTSFSELKWPLWRALAAEVLDPARGLPPHLERLRGRVKAW
jgi:tetratricopeptide (TPR) repeat protein